MSRNVPEFQDILFDVRDGVALITMNHPDRLNVFSGMMGKEIGQAYRLCDADDEIRVVVLTGAGRAFCAGADMSRREKTFEKQDERTFSAGGINPPAWELRKPVIAAVNGHAIGIGLTIALQCDIRFMALEGKYGIIQVRRGVMPDGWSHWTLQRIVGLSKAAEILLSGRTYTGAELDGTGIASRFLPSGEVLPAAMELARDMAINTAPLSVAVTKKLLWESGNLNREEVGKRETELHHHLMARPDAVEGPMAYIEKRAPEWKLSPVKDWPEWY